MDCFVFQSYPVWAKYSRVQKTRVNLPPLMLRLDKLWDWSLFVLRLSEVDDGREPVDSDSSRAMSRRVLRNVTLACNSALAELQLHKYYVKGLMKFATTWLQPYFWCNKLTLICTTPRVHLQCPPKFCITFVVNSFWVLQLPQEKLKTTIILLFVLFCFFWEGGGGGQGVIWEMAHKTIDDK